MSMIWLPRWHGGGIRDDGDWMRVTDTKVSSADKPAAQGLPDNSAALGAEPRFDQHYLFYCYTCGQNAGREKADQESAAGDTGGGLTAPYSWTIWRPKISPALPHGLSDSKLRLRFLFRWAVHRLHLFAGSGCGTLLIYDRERLAHYSGFTPRYWRFPFIGDGDFQIGDTWTDPAYRGQGLALFALQTIVTTLAAPRRRFWYVVEVTNRPSIRVVEKAQFKLAAEGTWVTPWGFKLAGSYVIRKSRSTSENRSA
jgi:RimJ/RimL family protein N-acetyltransferase